MPNSDTWPRAVSVETLSNMDSARSCDSVISVNSACSEDSMEHLSAEEKACLMYLEETIESLDLQEDSGFSNDEPDPAIRRIKYGGSETLSQPDIHRMLAESGGPSRAKEVSCETENPASQSSSSSTLDISGSELPSHIPPDPTHAGSEPASGNATPVPAQDTVGPTDGDPQSGADLSMIPPPSDFMDEPVSPPAQSDGGNSSATSPATPKPTINLEMLRRRVSEKNISGSSLSASGNPTSATPAIINHTPTSSTPVSPVTVAPASVSSASIEPTIVNPDLLDKPAPAAELPTAPSLRPSSPPTAAPTEAIEPRSPPAVAPKPKKLPPNIILKSHKPSGGQDSIMGHPSPSDRLLMDPQKVRMEALRKLGLLKSEESDPGPASSPKHLQTRMSWAPSSSPLSPPPLKSAPPSAPYTTKVHTLVPPSPQATHVPSEPHPDIIPVPTAFSDQAAPSHDDVFVVSSDQASPALDKKLLSSAGRDAGKSATLERSGLGLSSYMEAMDKQQTLGQLRNNRPRPASLGSGKDFAGERRVPAPSTSSDSSQKLPRSQGISVIISPGEQSEEARRKALKKLGLLRD